MAAEPAKGLVVIVRREGGAYGLAVALAPDLFPVHREDCRKLAGEDVHLLLAEDVGQEHPALRVELFKLVLAEFHDRLPVGNVGVRQRAPAAGPARHLTLGSDPISTAG